MGTQRTIQGDSSFEYPYEYKMNMIWSPESISLRQSSGDPDQMPHSVASGLGLHSLPMSHKKDARITWVKKVPVGEVVCFCYQLKSFRSLLIKQCRPYIGAV